MKNIEKKKNDLIETLRNYDFNCRNEISIMGQSLLNFFQYYYSIEKGVVFFINQEAGCENLTEIARIKEENEVCYKQQFQLNQGLIGACYTHKRTITINNLPEQYIKGTEYNNNEHPKQLICIPVQKLGLTVGVIELAVKEPFEDSQIQEIEQIVKNMVDESLRVLSQPKAEILANQSLITTALQTA